MEENKKEIIWNRIREIGFLLLSFFIPFVFLIIVLQVNSVALFSYEGKSILSIDMKSQYIAYMLDFKHILQSGGSLIYTNEKIFGGDYLSIYMYYLASPFNFLVVFFEENAVPLFFIWTCIMKICFASLNMYLLVRFSSKFRYHKLIPAIAYGLISYSFVYLSNYMWLDGLMILPLVILGLLFLKENKHRWLYPLALGYCLLTSWYIGFMVAIFVTLFFLALFITDYEKKNKANWKFLVRFAIFSLVTGIATSAWWLTAFIHLSGTKGTVKMPTTIYYSISIILSGFMENNFDGVKMITQSEEYITMFVGVVPLVFMITYFFNKKFTLRERMAFLAVFLFYLIFASNTYTDALLHGGRGPTWFPARYSFVIGFLICYLASKSLDEVDSLHPLYYIAPASIGGLALILVATIYHSETLPYYNISVPSVIMFYTTITVAVGYSIFTRYKFNNEILKHVQKYFFLVLSSLIVVEIASLYRGADKVVREFGYSNYPSYDEYLDDQKYQQSFDAIKAYDKEQFNSPFYRMEATFNRNGNYNTINNNPMFYGYNGLSNYSSSGKKDVEQYLVRVGFHYNNFFGKYNGGSTYAINSLLGIKYLVEDQANRNNFHPYFVNRNNTYRKLDIENSNGIDYYYNDKAAQLSFISDKNNATYVSEGKRINDSYVYWYDKFEYQNEMFKDINHNLNKPIFSPLVVDSLTTSLEYEQDEAGLYYYNNVKTGDQINITFHVPDEGIDYPLYFSEKNLHSNIDYYLDGKKYVNSYWYKGIYSFKDTSTHTHKLTIIFRSDFSRVNVRPELYYENVDTTNEYLDALNAGAFKVQSITKGLYSYGYKGTIEIYNNKAKELVFTIPNEKEISVKINGKKVENYTRFNIFTAVDLSSLSVGKYDVSITYNDKPFLVSFAVSTVGVVGLISLIVFYRQVESFLFFERKKEEEIAN